METNLDLLIAGCNTRCRHCYVDGGPEQAMPIESVRLLFPRLRRFLDAQNQLGLKASLTLDNEVFNHPQAPEVYALTAQYLKPYTYHHGSTTGLALLKQAEPEALLRDLKAEGWDTFSLSLHGGEAAHDQILGRTGAFKALGEAARLFKEAGCKLVISLIVGKPLIDGRDAVSAFLDQNPHDEVYMALVDHAPIQRLMDYLPLRPSMADLAPLAPYLQQWGVAGKAFFAEAARGSERACLGLMREWGIWDNIPRSSERIYLSLDQDLNLYYGNTGLRQAYLGNFAQDEAEALAEKTARLAANELFWDSCFNLDALPGFGGFDKDSKKAVEENLVFSDWDSCLSYWMARAGIPTRLI